MTKLFGPNWQTLISGIGAAIFSLLTVLSALPYTIGEAASIIPPEWKGKVFGLCAISTAILKTWNSIQQKDKNVTGGSVPQTIEAAERIEEGK
jgi:hypothetical protein